MKIFVSFGGGVTLPAAGAVGAGVTGAGWGVAGLSSKRGVSVLSWNFDS
ncbi:MAG TPA: hypothetical protein VKJ65_02320 [Phycisphaerae bacterium]|nr:hypothetical protein [Phycisphaerae bacterium]